VVVDEADDVVEATLELVVVVLAVAAVVVGVKLGGALMLVPEKT